MDKIKGIRKPFLYALCLHFLFFSLPAAALSADVTLRWTRPDDERVIGYNIYYGETGSDFKSTVDETIKPASTTKCVITGLTEGQSYDFAATSFDADGNESDFSETITYEVPLPSAAVDDDGDGFTENEGDCDDTDASIHPGATEICGDGIDQDCDGSDLSCTAVDNDGDGYTEDQGDCNDNNADIHPGASETCGDGIDQDCSGSDLTCPEDIDNDSDGYTENEGDCNDSDAAIHPGATEICGDGIDQDCNGVDPACSNETEEDLDGDGYTVSEGDCNDNNPAINPGAAETCGDGIDQDCSGSDLTCPENIDNDGDTYTENDGDCNDNNADIHPGAIEVCGDGIDQDCSGSDLSCTSSGTEQSEETATADVDSDGIADETEQAAPNNGDGNFDGIPDTEQAFVASFRDAASNQFITLESDTGTTLENCQAITPLPESRPTEAVFEWGLFEFTISGLEEGASTQLMVYLPEGAQPTAYQKYGPTPENPADHWYDFTDDGQTGAVINGNIITLYFTDAARGDDNPTPDGKIIDAGAPVYATASSSADDAASGSSSDSDGGGGGGGGGGCFITILSPFN